MGNQNTSEARRERAKAANGEGITTRRANGGSNREQPNLDLSRISMLEPRVPGVSPGASPRIPDSDEPPLNYELVLKLKTQLGEVSKFNVRDGRNRNGYNFSHELTELTKRTNNLLSRFNNRCKDINLLKDVSDLKKAVEEFMKTVDSCWRPVIPKDKSDSENAPALDPHHSSSGTTPRGSLTPSIGPDDVTGTESTSTVRDGSGGIDYPGNPASDASSTRDLPQLVVGDHDPRPALVLANFSSVGTNPDVEAITMLDSSPKVPLPELPPTPTDEIRESPVTDPEIETILSLTPNYVDQPRGATPVTRRKLADTSPGSFGLILLALPVTVLLYFAVKKFRGKTPEREVIPMHNNESKTA